MQHRVQRVAEAVKEAVAEIILNELSDPRLGFVTVTRTKVSRDLKFATVYVSIMGDEDARKSGLERLEHALAFIRRRLGRHVKLRHLPELRFTIDTVYVQERRIGEILDGLRPGPHQPGGQEDTAP